MFVVVESFSFQKDQEQIGSGNCMVGVTGGSGWKGRL